MTLTYSNNFFPLKKTKTKTFLNYNTQLLKHHKIINTKKLWSRFNGFKTFRLITLANAFSDISHEQPRHSPIQTVQSFQVTGLCLRGILRQTSRNQCVLGFSVLLGGVRNWLQIFLLANS